METMILSRPGKCRKVLHSFSIRICSSLLVAFWMTSHYAAGQQKLPVIEGLFNSEHLVFHITGDGGWGGFDSKLADEYRKHSMSYLT